jgi:RimJ/RimL family protein N-acetyltransferase
VVAIEVGAAGEVAMARLESSDRELLRRFFYRLSPQTLYRRFHSPILRPEQAHPDFLLDVDHIHREAVLAVVDGEIVGVARYARHRIEDPAEVAVVVADAWQRQGIATRLIRALADRARAAGIDRFTMSMQSDNAAVLALMRRIYPEARLRSDGAIAESLVRVA